MPTSLIKKIGNLQTRVKTPDVEQQMQISKQTVQHEFVRFYMENVWDQIVDSQMTSYQTEN